MTEKTLKRLFIVAPEFAFDRFRRNHIDPREFCATLIHNRESLCGFQITPNDYVYYLGPWPEGVEMHALEEVGWLNGKDFNPVPCGNKHCPYCDGEDQ